MRQSIAAMFAGVVLLLCTVPARGTIQRTFVSRNGSDLNTCAIDQPCRSFVAAIAQTSANGEIVVNDSAGYGPVTITKAVAIVSPLGVHAGISVFSGDGVTINAGATDVVVLRNLYINSQGGVNGITLTSAAALHIEHCVVSGFSGDGIHLTPTVGTNVEISDTIARQAGTSGIYAYSASPLKVSIVHCRMSHNSYGVKVNRATVGIDNSTADNNGSVGFGTQGIGPSLMAIESCFLSNNDIGVEVFNGVATVHNTMALNSHYCYYADLGGKLSLDHCVAAGGTDGVVVGLGGAGEATITDCTLTDNSSTGVYADISGIVRLTRNTISRNNYGIYNGGGTIHSTGDNTVEGNTTGETFGTITAANKA